LPNERQLFGVLPVLGEDHQKIIRLLAAFCSSIGSGRRRSLFYHCQIGGCLSRSFIATQKHGNAPGQMSFSADNCKINLRQLIFGKPGKFLYAYGRVSEVKFVKYMVLKNYKYISISRCTPKFFKHRFTA
jgi:hypothetical protein